MEELGKSQSYYILSWKLNKWIIFYETDKKDLINNLPKIIYCFRLHICYASIIHVLFHIFYFTLYTCSLLVIDIIFISRYKIYLNSFPSFIITYITILKNFTNSFWIGPNLKQNISKIVRAIKDMRNEMK